MPVAAIGVPLGVQPEPVHHKISYVGATPELSVDAVQVRLTCVLDAPVATKLMGTDGAIVSGAAEVVAVAALVYALVLLDPSFARI